MTTIRGTNAKQLLVFEQEVVCVVQSLDISITHELSFSQTTRDWADVSGNYHTARLGIPTPYYRTQGNNFGYGTNYGINSLVRYNNRNLYYRTGVWDVNEGVNAYTFCQKLFNENVTPSVGTFKLVSTLFPAGTSALQYNCTAQDVEAALNAMTGGTDYSCIGGPLAYGIPIYILSIGRYGVLSPDNLYMSTTIVPYPPAIVSATYPRNAIQELYHNIPPTSGSFTLSNLTRSTIDLDYDCTAQDVQDALNNATVDYPTTTAPGDRFICTGGPLNVASIFIESVGEYASIGKFSTVGALKFYINRQVVAPIEQDEGVLPGDVQIRFTQMSVGGNEIDIYISNEITENGRRLDHLNVVLFSTYLNWLEELNDYHEWGYGIEFSKVNALGEKIITDYESSIPYSASGYPWTYYEYFRQVRNLIKQISTDYHKCDYKDNAFWSGTNGSVDIYGKPSLGYLGPSTGNSTAYYKIKDWDFSPAEILELGQYGKYSIDDFFSLLPVLINKSNRANDFNLYPPVVGYYTGSRHDAYPYYGLSRTKTYTLYKEFYDDNPPRTTTLDLSTVNYADWEYFNPGKTVINGNQYRPMSDLTVDFFLDLYSDTAVIGDFTGSLTGQILTFNFHVPSGFFAQIGITLYPPGAVVNQVPTGPSYLWSSRNGVKSISDLGPGSIKWALFKNYLTQLGNTPVSMYCFQGHRGALGMSGNPNAPYFKQSTAYPSNTITAGILQNMLDEVCEPGNSITEGKHGSGTGDSLYSFWSDTRPYKQTPAYAPLNYAGGPAYPNISNYEAFTQYSFQPFKQNVVDLSYEEIIEDGRLVVGYGVGPTSSGDRFDITVDAAPGVNYSPSWVSKGVYTIGESALIIDTGGKSLKQFLGLKFQPSTLLNIQYKNYGPGNINISGFPGFFYALNGLNVQCVDIDAVATVSFGRIPGYLRFSLGRNTVNNAALASAIFDTDHNVLYQTILNSSSINTVIDIDVPELADIGTDNLFFIKFKIKTNSTQNDSIFKAKSYTGVTHWADPSVVTLNGIQTNSLSGTNANANNDEQPKFAFGNLELNTERNIYEPLGVPR